MTQEMQNIVDQLKPYECCRLGGAGNKVNRIALGEVDAYVQPHGGLSQWDLCAPETIIRAMGGIITKFPNTLDEEHWKFLQNEEIWK